MSNLSLYLNPSGSGSGGNSEGLITIVSKIGEFTEITPSGATTVSGLDNASDTITSPSFADAQVEIFYGNQPVPDKDMGDGGIYYTKSLSSDTITLSQALSDEDNIKIKVFGAIGTGGTGGSQDLNSVASVGNKTDLELKAQAFTVEIDSPAIVTSSLYGGSFGIDYYGELMLLDSATQTPKFITTVPNGGSDYFVLPSNGGYFVTSVDSIQADSTGNVPLFAWRLNGNSDTDHTVNYIGTTDNQDLVLKSNGAEGFRIYGSGATGIGGYGNVLLNPQTCNIGQMTMIDNYVGINTDIASYQTLPQAALHVKGSAIGSIPFPVMTAAQRIAIIGPLVGMHVYQSDIIEGVYVYKSDNTWHFAY